jgi:hypothetical protein
VVLDRSGFKERDPGGWHIDCRDGRQSRSRSRSSEDAACARLRCSRSEPAARPAPGSPPSPLHLDT